MHLNGESAAEDWQLAVLLAEVAAFVASYTATFVLVPLAAAATSEPIGTVGLVAAMPGFVGVVLALPSAGVSNRFGRQRLIQAAFVVLCAAVVGYLVAPGFVWLIPSQLALGLSMIAFWPSALAAFAEMPGRRSQELRQGLNTLLQGLGSFAGAAVAGGVAAQLGFPLAFEMLVPLAAVGLLLTPALRETSFAPGRTPDVDLADAVHRAVRLWRRDRTYAVAASALAPWSMLWWVAGATFFVLYATQAGYSPAFVGSLVALRIGVASLIRLLFAHITRRVPLVHLLLAGNALGGLGLAAAAISTAPLCLLASATLQGIGLSVVLPASNVMVMEGTAGRDRVVGLAMSSAMTNSAILIAAPVLAFVSASVGLASALAFAGLLATVLSGAVGLVVRDGRT